MSLGDDPIEIMSRLRTLMGDLDRSFIDLRRLQIGGSVDVKFAADPCKALTTDLAHALEQLLTRLEASSEYKLAVEQLRPYRDEHTRAK